MLITFERVWAVGRFHVGRSLLVVPKQPRAGTVGESGAHQSATCKKGGFPKLTVETAGYTLAQAFRRGGLGHTPLLITLVQLEKKKKRLDGGEEPREHDKHNKILIWSRHDGEHGRRHRRKTLSPF